MVIMRRVNKDNGPATFQQNWNKVYARIHRKLFTSVHNFHSVWIQCRNFGDSADKSIVENIQRSPYLSPLFCLIASRALCESPLVKARNYLLDKCELSAASQLRVDWGVGGGSWGVIRCSVTAPLCELQRRLCMLLIWIKMVIEKATQQCRSIRLLLTIIPRRLKIANNIHIMAQKNNMQPNTNI